jgi:hypothetical protein
MKTIFESIKHLLLFKPYTNMPRRIEIGYGIIVWAYLGLIIYVILKHVI